MWFTSLRQSGLRYTACSAGHYHTALVRSDGRAFVVGRDDHGQTAVPALPPGLRFLGFFA